MTSTRTDIPIAKPFSLVSLLMVSVGDIVSGVTAQCVFHVPYPSTEFTYWLATPWILGFIILGIGIAVGGRTR